MAASYRCIIADHANPRFIPILVTTKGGSVPALWLRGLKLRGMAAARLLFMPDYRLLCEALPAIHWHMLRAHRIVGLYMPRVAALRGLRSLRRPGRGPSAMVKGDVADEDVNLLYSELLYLPL